MLLERLTIHNYGVYAGTSEFDLTCTAEKPIVLVGGLNGAGKTTIFESLMIALYGRSYLGRRTSKKDYMGFVSDRLHRHEGVRADSGSVMVAFRFYHNGHEDAYEVTRGWVRVGASVTESFMVVKNGEAMSDVDESQWQSFIEGLLPLGIARLFFFDGEKIARMTKWNDPDNDEIRSSLDILLGAELIDRLRSDLELYMVRRAGRTGNDPGTSKKRDELLAERDDAVSEIRALTAEREKKTQEIKKLSSDMGIRESKIAGVGGGYADIRTKLLTRRATLGEKIRHQKRSMQERLGDDAPLFLIPGIMNRIKSQVESDLLVGSQKSSASVIQDRIEAVKRDMASESFWPDGTDVSEASKAVSARLDRMVEEPQTDAFFDIAPNDAGWMLGRIDAMDAGRSELLGEIRQYADTVKLLEKTEAELVKIPKDDEIGPKISEINAMYQEMGTLESELAHMEQQISSKTAHKRIVQSKLKDLISSIHKAETDDAGMRLAARMQDVLDTYSTRLRERKISELESNLLDAVKTLLHKKHIVRIEIDRDTFEIRAYERDSDEPGNLKSMGEKQIVGTALLWAIARTSGRSLPFVIDTPLGRLDGKHLSNLMSRFYPFASHQLVLLSTDREIGPKEYAMLSRYVSRSYRITCDEARSITTATTGYFMEEHVAQA